MRKKYSPLRPQPRVNSYAQEDAAEAETEAQTSEPAWRVRFGLRGLLTLMLMSSVLFAGGGYLLHAVRGGGRGFQLAFILFTLVGPMALLAVFSVAAWALQNQNPFGRHPSADPDDGDEH